MGRQKRERKMMGNMTKMVMVCVIAALVASGARPVMAKNYNKYTEMTAEELSKLREYATSPSFQAQAEAAFNSYDSNADGHISLDEFDGLLATIGGNNMKADEKHSIISMADRNNDGRINAEEWFGMVTMKP